MSTGQGVIRNMRKEMVGDVVAVVMWVEQNRHRSVIRNLTRVFEDAALIEPVVIGHLAKRRNGMERGASRDNPKQ